MLKKIVDKEWSSVYIYGLSKRSREEAMRELVTEHLMENQCKNCPISHTSKVADSACPEELPDQLKKLLTACELRKFFDKKGVWISRLASKSVVCTVPNLCSSCVTRSLQ